VIVVGMLSGTSADGIDVAAAHLELDGDTVDLAPLGHRTVPFSDDVRDLLGAVLPPAEGSAATICALDTRLGEALGDAAAEADRDLCGGDADLVVSHGQTIHHWVEGGRCLGTLQVGQPAFVAARSGLPVVSDLRAADVAAGGHGAPLASLFDHLLLADGSGRRVALNLGGIANLTLVDDGRLVTAFDTGPANTLIDAAARLVLQQPYDVDGEVAATGEPSEPLLTALLGDPYYALPAPKSTGRERFDDRYLLDVLARCGLRSDGDDAAAPTPGGSLAPADLLATVTELTARTVADAIARAGGADEIVVSGGGVHNVTLLELVRALTGTPVEPIDRHGVPADGKEAYLFALLGFLSVHGLPGADPAATGACTAAVLGSLTPPSARLADPLPAGHVVRRLRVSRA
jgi:anhydro-N-acetylmuramic acid kinase